MTLVSEMKPSPSTAPSSARRPGRRMPCAACAPTPTGACGRILDGDVRAAQRRGPRSPRLLQRSPLLVARPSQPQRPLPPPRRRDEPRPLHRNRAALNSMCDAVSRSAPPLFIWTTPATPSAPRAGPYLVHQSQTRMNPIWNTPSHPHVDAGRAEGILDGRGLVAPFKAWNFWLRRAWDPKDQAPCASGSKSTAVAHP